MALPAFPIKAFQTGGTYADAAGAGGDPDQRAQNGILTSIYGTTSGDVVIYGITTVSQNSKIFESKLQTIATKAIEERVRRGGANILIPAGYFSGKILASRIQEIRTVVEVPGPAQTQAYASTGSGNPNIITFPQAGVPSGAPTFSRDTKITATDINALIQEVNNAGQVCTCNCNYCTCNCNYCTCNCNYGCTCNCNYSDEQLKSQVEYM